MYRKTYVEIDLGAIKHNITFIKKMIGADVRVLLPVKADAYGHGLVEISSYVESRGLVDMLGVASLSEGMELREAGITIPILILGLLLPCDELVDHALDHNLTLTVADIAQGELISARAKKKNIPARIHLKIDTGMGRIGCTIIDARSIVSSIMSLKNINLEGIYTHFPAADSGDREFTENQILKFSALISDLDKDGIRVPLVHVSNSAGILNFPEAHFNMIRPGIISYGYPPSPNMEHVADIIPSMTLKSNIIFVKQVPEGTPLSYGLTYKTDKKSTIATIPIGYGDGYSRSLSNKSRVLIDGKEYPLVGRVTMDQILVNLGNDTYPLGQEVILFGKEKITAATIAGWMGTIPYEVTCGISKRVRRKYIY